MTDASATTIESLQPDSAHAFPSSRCGCRRPSLYRALVTGMAQTGDNTVLAKLGNAKMPVTTSSRRLLGYVEPREQTEIAIDITSKK
ncbi:hypothetical protein Ae201684_017025 [Aphanomyces euteiches]|uniref:Uncharacterized protein n=1 Tax=Aphanomyces euteiches TaxID=100861 RepID=A0A6G0WAS0_9STRA|nr:hypothetical protein Ae201684_017025 [Aphanomyces euteiches]